MNEREREFLTMILWARFVEMSSSALKYRDRSLLSV